MYDPCGWEILSHQQSGDDLPWEKACGVVLPFPSQVNGYPTVFNTELAEYGNQSGALDETLAPVCSFQSPEIKHYGINFSPIFWENGLNNTIQNTF